MSEHVALPDVSEVVLAQSAVPLDVRPGMGRREERTDKHVVQLREGIQMTVCCRPCIQDEVRNVFVSVSYHGKSSVWKSDGEHVLLGHAFPEVQHTFHGCKIEGLQLQLDIRAECGRISVLLRPRLKG